ncbi:hypothetical protein ABZ876_35405 [Streptomyces sp. NPDC046931]|uniref:hypothetical protein n=1 Tax=Streptomyces sp. NPDC046931 TaxID=3154806 RepID=UPI0033CEB56D
MPGLLADHLAGTWDVAVREVLWDGQAVRRGQGYSVHVTAALALPRDVLEQCTPPSPATVPPPADRKVGVG